LTRDEAIARVTTDASSVESAPAEQFPISVMYPQSRHLSAKVRIFVDWVSELIQRDPIFRAR